MDAFVVLHLPLYLDVSLYEHMRRSLYLFICDILVIAHSMKHES